MSTQGALLRVWNAFKNGEQNVRGSYNALKNISVEHERAHAGRVFYYSDITSLAAGSVDSFLLTVSSGQEMHLRTIRYEADVGPCEGYLYENPFVNVNSLGTALSLKNCRRDSANIAPCSSYTSPFFDINSAGEQIDSGAIVAATGGPIKSISGQASSAITEWVLKADNRYVYRFKNNNAGTALIVKSILAYDPKE